jgi:hypothetical protein
MSVEVFGQVQTDETRMTFEIDPVHLAGLTLVPIGSRKEGRQRRTAGIGRINRDVHGDVSSTILRVEMQQYFHATATSFLTAELAAVDCRKEGKEAELQTAVTQGGCDFHQPIG